MKKKTNISLIYVGGFIAILLFFLTVTGICVFFYNKDRENAIVPEENVKHENVKQDDQTLNLNYIGLENIPFLSVKQEEFIKEYEAYILDELKRPKVTTSIFFSNYEQMSNNTYVVFSQIDDTKSSVIQTIVNVKEFTYDFSVYDKEIDNIEELGGVKPRGEETLADKYKTKAATIEYAKVEWNEEKVEEAVKNDVENVVTKYAYEKYKNTDIQVTSINLKQIRKENEYKIFEFQMDDLTSTIVAVYCVQDSPFFTMEL